MLWQGEDVLKVSQGAAFRRGDGWAVFRVVSDKARLTPEPHREPSARQGSGIC